MNRQIITFSADEQKLVKTGGINCYASNIVSYIEAHFALGQNWSGYDSVRAVWSNDNNMTVISTVLDSNGHCVVPFEVLKTMGVVKVNLVGSISVSDVLADRLTTFPCEALTVARKAKINGSETAPITPSQFEQFIAVVISEVEKVTGMSAVAETLPAGSSATARYENGVLYLGIPQGIQGERGEAGADGNGIAQVLYNSDYSITFIFTNGERFTTPSLRGETGPQGQPGQNGRDGADGRDGTDGTDGVTPSLSVGTVTTLPSTEDAYVTRRGTDENPVFDFGIPQGPKGDKGDTGEVSLDELLNNTIIQTLTDTEPYNFRATPTCGSLEYDEIVGASIGWNQLVNTTDTSVTIQSGHKYYSNINNVKTIGLSNGTAISINDGTKDNIIDLTLVLGSTIADYVYSLETATAGAGVAWLKSHFPKLFGSYQPYDAGSIKSVSGLTAHVMRDSSDNIIGSYPLDSSVTLRGQYKLDANNKLYADGDVWKSSGEIERNYYEFTIDGTVPIGTGFLARSNTSRVLYNYASLPVPMMPNSSSICKIVADVPTYRPDYVYSNDIEGVSENQNSTAYGIWVSIANSKLSEQSIAGIKEYLNQHPITVVYPRQTPTTETALPYTNPQQVESGGTEEYVGAEIAVGHETQYPMTLGDTMPKSNGTYTMSVTVSNGKKTINWT